MLLAVISDIHGNLEALKAVYKNIRLKGVDHSQIKCLGDIVGYGPEPNGCVELIREKEIESVMGNHDWAAVSGDTRDFNYGPKVCLEWTVKQLKPENINYLKTLHYTIFEVIDDQIIQLVHANPLAPNEFGYILNPDDAQEALESMESDEIVFIGHSHFPLIISEKNQIMGVCEGKVPLNKGKNIINVGSVGQPRDGDSRACYAIYDTIAKEVEICRVEYDIKTTERKISKSGMPEETIGWLNWRLRAGR